PPRCCLSSGRRRVLHSSPTRRSSDLGQGVELRSFLQRSHQVAALQGRHHPAVEFFRAERLAQEIVGAMLDELGAERAFGIGGNANDDQVVEAQLLAQQLDQLEATDAGHGMVEHQQVDVRLEVQLAQGFFAVARLNDLVVMGLEDVADVRSEEHTSELQSRENLVCRLL